MRKDPIVEKIHKIREEYAKKFNYDVHKICKDIRREEQKHPERLVSFPAKKPGQSPRHGKQSER